MIVVCERCDTRFQLDESRIPARGVQVRCSRCKHSFFVSAPGSTADTVAQEVVAEATSPGGSSAPAVTTDLDRTAFDANARGASESEDDEWEFNEDPPAAARARPTPSPAAPPRTSGPEIDVSRAAASPEPAPEDVPDSLLDELGDPRDWDFGEESAEGAAQPPVAAEERATPDPAAQEPPAREEPEPAPRRAASKRKRSRKREKKATARPQRSRSRTSRGVSSLLLEAVGYLAVALLFSVGLGRVVERGVQPGAAQPAASTRALAVTASGAEGVRVDFLENASAGTIVVVRGRRLQAAQGSALRVEWTDHGRPIPGTATLAGPALPLSWLYEADPGELRRLLAAAAARADALGAAPTGGPPSSGFVAVYDTVPQGATGLRITPVSLPGASPTAAPARSATAGGKAGPAAAPGAPPAVTGSGVQQPAPVGAAPTPSSPPSPRPSSG